MSKCADPILCFTINGKKLYRHFSLIKKHTQILQRKTNLVFDCGKCLMCRKKKAYELASRCVLHASLYDNNAFITLTYDETKDGYHNEMDYTDIQKFKKRLRSYIYRTFKRRIELFNVHEYGKLGKKHWHLIVFNEGFSDKELYTVRNGIPLYRSPTLERLWPFGFSTIGDVTEASAMYQSQYMEKDFKNGNVTNGKKSKSKHSGIGKPYFLKHYKQILSLGYVPIGGKKLPVPRYFQKLAKKHWAHFNQRDLFYDTQQRKQQFRPFKDGEANEEISKLFDYYTSLKAEYLKELEINWSGVISQYLTTSSAPDFIKANKNALRDLKNKNQQERF